MAFRNTDGRFSKDLLDYTDNIAEYEIPNITE